MIKRVVEVNTPSCLRVQRQQLVIEQGEERVASVPIEDLGVLIVANRQNVLTQQMLSVCAANNVVVVLCDENFLPSSLLLPLSGHTLHAAVLRNQISASKSHCEKIWQQIVKAKLEAQASCLQDLGRPTAVLDRLAAHVAPGDTKNFEAQGARYYWRALFGKAFRRDPTEGGANAFLNYGYSIVRACMARALVGAGLHPAIGIKHCNQYNDFALADDLVEPLRPFVDRKVVSLDSSATAGLLTKEVRGDLLALTVASCEINARQLPLLSALHEYASSLRSCLQGEAKILEVPRFRFSEVIGQCGSS